MDQGSTAKPGGARSGGYRKALKWFPPQCMICGWDISVDVHHVSPISEGGTNALTNLAVLCPNHHRMAHLGLTTREELTECVRRAIDALRPTALSS
jgi:predicted HNH restriction endonuclease